MLFPQDYKKPVFWIIAVPLPDVFYEMVFRTFEERRRGRGRASPKTPKTPHVRASIIDTTLPRQPLLTLRWTEGDLVGLKEAG